MKTPKIIIKSNLAINSNGELIVNSKAFRYDVIKGFTVMFKTIMLQS